MYKAPTGASALLSSCIKQPPAFESIHKCLKSGSFSELLPYIKKIN